LTGIIEKLQNHQFITEKRVSEMKAEMIKLNVHVYLEDFKEEPLPKSMVYVYDQSGKFIMASRLKEMEGGQASLELPSSMLGQAVKVVVGPPLNQPDNGDENDQDMPPWMVAMLKDQGEFPDQPGRTTLKRLGAVHKTYRLAEDDNLLHMQVYQHDWAKWLTCQCVVRGRLIKRVPMPDGSVEEWGVCGACVQVYEVDSFSYVVAHLPDHDLLRLRDELIAIAEPWPPIPPKAVEKSRIRSWPSPPPPVERLSSSMMFEAEMMSGALESIARATSISHLRSEMIIHAAKVVKYACTLTWFMGWFEKDLISCMCTDHQGYFETTITYTCDGDHPDLYFKACQCIGGSLHTLYDPGVVCHTHWDYTCGTEVVLETTDPAATVCAPSVYVNPPPGVSTYILINRIGGLLINDIGSDGLVDYTFNLVKGTVSATDAPFGGTLGFRVSHSQDIPSSNLKYYRWLYNKNGDNDFYGNPKWHEFVAPIAPSVGRHYADFDETQPTKPPTFPVYTLGPKSIAGMTMYEFRPSQSDLQGTAPPDHVYQWPVEPIGDDIYSAKLNSPLLPEGPKAAVGEYHFRLEIYDDTGSLVDPTTGAFDFIVMTNKAGDSRYAKDSEPLPQDNEIQNGGFQFTLCIDNRECEAIIDEPSIGGIGADPNCGFLKYTASDSVALNFHALHPATSYDYPAANYASFRFWIRRGANKIIEIEDEVNAAYVGDWTGTDGNFNGSFTPAVLLDTCNQAAFAEILRVYAKATNGYRRLHEYDDDTEWAFALTKEEAS
jgi:hypothetical protein